ncbi:hypothetical protein BJL95_11320 [Methylomonas sp. LWB]|uniref:hypothetical protein n=1 Tax=Methylomonas sp. LWB TaxID=1905845 RepID=UPI0008D9F22C|nr:hypothetical protein [Methylomonas sp. LWB]OHX36351.1 hypothetical protein BJL95_11320 [Methylomonas sp. LWB]
MTAIPFSIAWYLAAHPDTVRLGTNHGELIQPPLQTEPVSFVGADTFSQENIGELKGHWVLINPVFGACSQVCADALHKSRQIGLMIGKDIARVRRLALLSDGQVALPGQWREDARLLKALPADSLRAGLSGIAGQAPVEGALIIMDPLGNLMMKYPPGFDPYQVRDDLSKLLRISQIG